MATVRHTFESAKDDPADATLIGASEWNDSGAHEIEGVVPVVNVMDPEYGATGLGVADDTDAIQAAIDTGKRVYIPEGTYLIPGGLTCGTSAQHIQGAGLDATILVYTGSGAAWKNANSVNLLRHGSLSGVSIDFTGASAGARGLELDNFYKWKFDNVRVLGHVVTAGIGIKFVGSATHSTYFNSFFDVHVQAGTACVDFGDQCNANTFYGGLLEGGGIAVNVQPATTESNANKFFGTAIQTENATIVRLGGGGAAVTDYEFIGCRVEPGAPAVFSMPAANSARHHVIGGSWSDVTFTPNGENDGHVIMDFSDGIWRYYHTNQADPKKTLEFRGSSTGVVGLTFVQDTNLYRLSANILKTDDELDVAGVLRALNELIVTGGLTAQANVYFGASQDTNLYRSAANTLRTDDQLAAGDGLVGKYVAGVGKTNLADGDFTVTPANGATGVAHNTTDGKSYSCARANGTWKSVEVAA